MLIFNILSELNIKVTEEMFTSFTEIDRNVFQKTIFNSNKKWKTWFKEKRPFHDALITKLI
jgi:hypothetical protein